MAFTRDDLSTYETKPQTQLEGFDPFNPTTPAVAKEPEPTAQASADTEVDAAIAASVNTEPTAEGDNDGSTTENQAESVAATSPDPEGVKDPNLEEVTDGKPRSRAQERIEELVAERNSLREYGKYLLEQVSELRKSPATKSPEQSSPTAPPESKEDPAPTLESAEFDPIKLSKLQSEWNQRQINKGVEQAVRQIEARQNEVATRQAFENKAAEFRKNTPDFDLVISNPALPSLATEAAKVVVKSDNGPAIAYHLAKNPDLAIRIARMEPGSQAAAIGRLEEQLVRAKADASNTTKEPSKSAAPVKQVAVTKAPPPPKPVTGSSSVVKDQNIMNMDEWVSAERAKKIAQKSEKLKLRQALRR